MILPLQVAGDRFAARCVLRGKPDQEILGTVDTGATVTCVDVRTCRQAGLEFAGEDARLRCVHREHREVLRTYFGNIDICGRAEHARVYELDMGPEHERGGVNAILGLDVLGSIKITIDVPGGTGTIERRAGA